MFEREFLKKYNQGSSFITELYYAFQDNDSFYLICELCEGGDLRYYMLKSHINENKAKFIIACVILALEFLHNNGYTYRDLKPENILLDSKGYALLGDFKLTRDISAVNFHDASGTPGYMAPEIILNQNHGCASDLFSLGVIAYELMLGHIPYKASSRLEYKANIVSEINLIKNSDLPEGWSQESADFINKCIKKRPMSRIGYNSMEEIKDHRWFINLYWGYIKNRIFPPSLIPGFGTNYKVRPKSIIFDNSFESYHINNILLYIEDLEIQCYFDGYFYDSIYKKYLKETKVDENIRYKMAKLEELIEERIFHNDSEDLLKINDLLVYQIMI